MLTLVVIILVICVIAGLPNWSYWGPNRNYGYAPSLGGLLLLLIVLWLLFGHGRL